MKWLWLIVMQFNYCDCKKKYISCIIFLISDIYAPVIEVDECESSPCLHGNCTNGKNGFTCECQDGFTGSSCETGKI